MKRILLAALCISAFSIDLNAQCTPNTAITTPGIYPDSATGLTPAVQGVTYNQDLQIRVPSDTVIVLAGTPFNVSITSITLTDFYNLPPGISYTCNPPNCVFNGGTNGCVLLNGTPTQSGTFYPVAVTLSSGILTDLGQPVLQTDTIDYYTLVVNTTIGLDDPSASSFSMQQNSPNPYNDFTTVSFTSPVKSEIQFSIHNMIGKEVYRKSIDADAGLNTLEIDGRDFSPGVYMYSMTWGNNTLTHRMVISRK